VLWLWRIENRSADLLDQVQGILAAFEGGCLQSRVKIWGGGFCSFEPKIFVDEGISQDIEHIIKRGQSMLKTTFLQQLQL